MKRLAYLALAVVALPLFVPSSAEASGGVFVRRGLFVRRPAVVVRQRAAIVVPRQRVIVAPAVVAPIVAPVYPSQILIAP